MTRAGTRLSHRQRHALWRLAIGGVLAATGSLAVVTAFGIAPASSLDASALEPAPAPALFALSPIADDQEAPLRFTEPLRRGDTFGSLLTRTGVAESDIRRLLGDRGTQRLMSKLRPGQLVEVSVDGDGSLRSVQFVDGEQRSVRIEAAGDGLVTRIGEAAASTTTRFAAGEIRSSLFAATDDADIPDAVASQLVEIFSGVVDFHRGLRKGDRFWVVYEQSEASGQALQAGRVLAAEFRNGDREHVAYWYQPKGERGGYYSADGKSLRRQFLLSPLEFSRVTSGFSMSRFHPVLQQWRAHRGIDYGAPSGTKVRSTADGVVEAVGSSGGYGNLVVVRHAGAYSTAYAHLSGFAAGIRRGSRVEQGQTLGYVGMTGLASGPHLHYEFRVNGSQIDPQQARLPEAPPLSGGQRLAFERERDVVARQIGFAKQTILARFE